MWYIWMQSKFIFPKVLCSCFSYALFFFLRELIAYRYWCCWKWKEKRPLKRRPLIETNELFIDFDLNAIAHQLKMATTTTHLWCSNLINQFQYNIVQMIPSFCLWTYMWTHIKHDCMQKKNASKMPSPVFR